MSSPSHDSAVDALRAMKGPLGRVHHDLSNPLAIISGNLQLLKEVASMEGASDLLVESISDALAAVEQFDEPMDRLAALRKGLEQSIERLEAAGR